MMESISQAYGKQIRNDRLTANLNEKDEQEERLMKEAIEVSKISVVDITPQSLASAMHDTIEGPSED